MSTIRSKDTFYAALIALLVALLCALTVAVNVAQSRRIPPPRLPANYHLWLKIGRCEQPGREKPGNIWWSHPGPTYGGGLGIYIGTWRAFKPRGYPSTPGRATWRQQMRVANRIKARYGITAWGCGRR